MTDKISSYKDLHIWQRAIQLVVVIYKLCDTLPTSEQYGLCSQMKRASVSIPSNIAEGSRRNTKADFYHFLTIAYGSGAELETQLEIVRQLNMTDSSLMADAEQALDVLMKMLNKFRYSLK